MTEEREPKQGDNGAPKPDSAPIETPEADPRTEGAPDPEERSVDSKSSGGSKESTGSGDSKESTQEQIQEGFE
jgi:hypothetical protein